MKLSLTALAVFLSSILTNILFSQMAFAKSAVETSAANLNKGNIEVGGGFSWSQDNASGSSNAYYSIEPRAEYFIADSFSVGGNLSYAGQNGPYGYSGFGMGPSASLYFYQQGGTAGYFAQSILFEKYSSIEKTYMRGATTLGVKFFAVPAVAFGIGLTSGYDMANTGVSSTIRLSGSFSFYY